jgi:hypothetical protein
MLHLSYQHNTLHTCRKYSKSSSASSDAFSYNIISFLFIAVMKWMSSLLYMNIYFVLRKKNRIESKIAQTWWKTKIVEQFLLKKKRKKKNWQNMNNMMKREGENIRCFNWIRFGDLMIQRLHSISRPPKPPAKHNGWMRTYILKN